MLGQSGYQEDEGLMRGKGAWWVLSSCLTTLEREREREKQGKQVERERERAEFDPIPIMKL